jgi:hypothetical protein
MLVAGIAAGVVTWAAPASAGPAVITASRVEAYSAPSPEASVVSELGQGAPVCVLDETNHSGSLLHRVGWLAIRLPGGVGYVPAEAVNLAAPAPEVADCGGSAAAPEGPTAAPEAQPPVQGPAAVPRPGGPPAVVFPGAPATRPGEPPAVVDRSALLPGGFLPLRPARFVLGIGSGMEWLDKQAAGTNQIGDSGITLNGVVGLTLWDIVTASATFSFASPSDRDSFTEEVVPVTGGGGPQTADSTLLVASYSIAIGLRTPFWAIGRLDNGWATGSLFAQYGSAGVSGSREISNCSDCRKDDLDLSGGTFWRVGVDLLVPAHKPMTAWGVTVSYERFTPGAGLSDELRIGFSWWL